MKNILSFLLVLPLFLIQTSCLSPVTGEGPVISESRTTEPFNKIALNMSADVIISESSEAFINIKAQQNIADIIVTRVDGMTLVITSKGNIMFSEPVTIEIGTGPLESVELNGSGTISGATPLRGEMFDLEVNGSGSIHVQTESNQVSGGISGSGKINLSGTTGDIRFQINGSGFLDAAGLSAMTATLKINGSGEMKINASSRIDATINGSGQIYYVGNPEIQQSVHGSGSISAAGRL